MRQASDEDLASAAHAGDTDALRMLYQRWAGRLYGFFAVRMPDGALADAEVLAADTLSEAWLSLRNSVPGHFTAWIYAIARRVLAAYLRSRGLRADGGDDGDPAKTAKPGKPVLVPIDASTDPGDPAVWLRFRDIEQDADWPAFSELLRDSIDSLPRPYRLVLRASLRNFLAVGPPQDEEIVTGQKLARRIGITPRQADRQRSDGLGQLYKAFTVTAMARGYGDIEPCPRFRHWAGGENQGPLPEELRDRLVRHVPQCPQCSSARKRLHSTMELFPVLIPALIPARLLTPESPAAGNLLAHASRRVRSLTTANPTTILSVVMIASVALLSASDAPGHVLAAAHPRTPPGRVSLAATGLPARAAHPTARPQPASAITTAPPAGVAASPSATQTTRPAASHSTPAVVQTSPSPPPAVTPPTASLTVAETGNGIVQADASGSSAGSSPIASFSFDWGDQQTTDGQASPAATHTYTADGTYTVQVTVTDMAGNTSVAASQQITVVSPTGPIVFTANGDCLDHQFDQSTDNDNVLLAPCDGNTSQQWTITPTGELQTSPDECMQAALDPSTLNVLVLVMSCNYYPQVFNFNSGSSQGEGTITQGNYPDSCMSVYPDNLASFETCGASANETWDFPVTAAIRARGPG